MGINHISGKAAGRDVTSIVSGAVNQLDGQFDKLVTVVDYQFITLIVHIHMYKTVGVKQRVARVCQRQRRLVQDIGDVNLSASMMVRPLLLATLPRWSAGSTSNIGFAISVRQHPYRSKGQ